MRQTVDIEVWVIGHRLHPNTERRRRLGDLESCPKCGDTNSTTSS
jgi:hypothetical protein